MTTENRRILIIDDERPILLTLEALLGRHGYQVETSGTASLGLKLLKRKSPALVLLDLQLPDAEGLQTLDEIKREFPGTQVKHPCGGGTFFQFYSYVVNKTRL